MNKERKEELNKEHWDGLGECFNCKILRKAIQDKICECDGKSFKHCFRQGKMCDECWERKKPLMELLALTKKIEVKK